MKGGSDLFFIKTESKKLRKKKMAKLGPSRGLALPLLLLLLLLRVDYLYSQVVYVKRYAETAKDYTLKPEVKGTIENILWKFSKDKLVEFEAGVLDWYLFKGRGDLNTKTGDLTLTELKKEDSGQYQSEIQVNEKLQYSYHDLRVIDAVLMPEVTCNKNSEGQVTGLECSVNQETLVTYEWNVPGDIKQNGKTLNISSETDHNSVYYCIASNPVSKKSTEFHLNVCYKGEAQTGGGNNPGLYALFLIPILLAILAVVGFMNKTKILHIIHEYRTVAKHDEEANLESMPNSHPNQDGNIPESSPNIENGNIKSTEEEQEQRKKQDENQESVDVKSDDAGQDQKGEISHSTDFSLPGEEDYENTKHMKSEDERLIASNDQGRGEHGEDNEDYENTKQMKSKDESSTAVCPNDQDSGENGDQSQKEDTSCSPDSGKQETGVGSGVSRNNPLPLVEQKNLAAVKVGPTIEKYENMDSKPKILTFRDAV